MRAIKKLKVMGNGFGMIPVGGSYLVQSVPAELNMDHTVVLQLAEVSLRRVREFEQNIQAKRVIRIGSIHHILGLI